MGTNGSPTRNGRGQGVREGVSAEEREALRASFRDLIKRHAPEQHGDEFAPGANEGRELWQRMASIGLTAFGGDASGADLRATLVLFEELGSSSCEAPLAGAVLMNMLMAEPGPHSDVVGELHRGEAVVAVAFGIVDGDRMAGAVESRSGELEGKVRFVEDAEAATHILLLCRSAAAIVPRHAPGVEVVPTPGLPKRPLSDVRLRSVTARVLECPEEKIADAVQVARLAYAARALGAAQRGFDLAVAHSKLREQFGQPIGRFQAVQHKLANSLISLDATRLSIEAAGDAYDSRDAEWAILAAAALAYAGPALRSVVLHTHQVLGAIGYSEEHEATSHFRSVHSDVVRLGGVLRANEELVSYLARSAKGGQVRTLPSVDLGPRAEEFRSEVRHWLSEHWTPERRAAHLEKPYHMHGWDQDFSRLMGRHGLIGIGWPQEIGGAARTPSEQIVLATEMALADAPVAAHSNAETIVAHSIFTFGTEAQKAEWLPRIKNGECSFALGYSESEAGSDLAALRTRAVMDGDGWVVDGHKLWSTAGDKAQYMWFAVRTDGDSKQGGISLLMVDLRSPGITIRPSVALYGKTFSAIHCDGVRVPASNLVGEVNGGWKIITHALATERVKIASISLSLIERAFEKLVAHVAGTQDLVRDQRIRERVGALAADILAARQLQVRCIRMVEEAQSPVTEAAIVKVFVSELQERVGQAGLDVLGSAGLLDEEDAGAPVPEMEWLLRSSIMMMIGGGTNEIQRNVIAQRGVGLPR